MAIVILACGLLCGLAGAGLGLLTGLTVWGSLGLGGLAGNLGAAALVLALLWRAARDEAPDPPCNGAAGGRAARPALPGR